MSYEDKFYSFHKSLTFDDVLIIPTNRSSVKSRLDVNLETNLTRKIKIKTPILASPMDRVTNYESAKVMDKYGAIACFHRFQSVDDQYREVKKFFTDDPQGPIIAAVSAQIEDSDELERINRLSELCDALVIDTAMGTNTKVLKAIEFIKNKFPSCDIIAGNVVTPEGCKSLIDAGADAIRTGIGNGSGCLTRIQTGVGRGQLSVIIESADLCRKNSVSLISDGGHSTPGDVAKALAAGADVVMMGSPLAGHDESPGEVFYKYESHYFKGDDEIYLPGVGLRKAKFIPGLKLYKQYRGMASKEAQVDWRGGLKSGTTFEGIQKHLRLKGKLSETLENLIGGIRSSLTYCDALTIEQFQTNAKFEKLSLGAQKESYDRD